MIGLDYLVAGYLHLASDVVCRARKTPDVSVVASDSSVQYDTSRTQDQLDTMQTDTISPYAKGAITHVDGLTVGEISLSQNMRFYQETYAQLNTGCLSIDTIKVKIHIKPTVYIARHFEPGSCMYKAVLEHERKHVAADQEVMGKYTRLIRDSLSVEVSRYGYVFGPFGMRQLQPEQKKLEQHFQGIVIAYHDQMTAERRKRQQAIDTLAEYQRVQNSCARKKGEGRL